MCKFKKTFIKICLYLKKSITFASLFTKGITNKRHLPAELAQLVEQRIRNAWVGGSSPPFGSKREYITFFIPAMFIYNTTFQASIDDAQNLIIYLHEKYIPEAQQSGLMKNARMSRILSHRDEQSECFSVQFEAEEISQIHQWYSSDGKRLNDKLLELFNNQVVGFPTIMEVIE